MINEQKKPQQQQPGRESNRPQQQPDLPGKESNRPGQGRQDKEQNPFKK